MATYSVNIKSELHKMKNLDDVQIVVNTKLFRKPSVVMYIGLNKLEIL